MLTISLHFKLAYFLQNKKKAFEKKGILCIYNFHKLIYVKHEMPRS